MANAAKARGSYFEIASRTVSGLTLRVGRLNRLAADYELESSDVVAYPCWYNSRLGSNSKVAGGGASDNIPNISDNIKSLPREIL